MSQHYTVTQGPLTLAPGRVVRLNGQQAALRAHALKQRKDGAYEVVQPVQFKNGEVLGFDDVPDKAILSAFFSMENIKAIQAEATKPVKPNTKQISNQAAGNHKLAAGNKPPAGNGPSAPPASEKGKD